MRTVKLYANKGQKASTMLRKHIGYSGRAFSKGAYARVFWSPELKRVIKVGELDDPYLEYLRLIKREKSNLVPKIDKVFICYTFPTDYDVDQDGRGSYAVIMERLYHAKTPRQCALRTLIIEAIDAEGCVPLELFVIANPRAALVADIIRMTNRITSRVHGDSIDIDLDMHNDNVMFRANGQPVITDPYC